MKLIWIVAVGYIILTCQAVKDSHERNTTKKSSSEQDDRIRHNRPFWTKLREISRWLKELEIYNHWHSFHRHRTTKPTTPPPTQPTLLTFDEWLEEWNGEAEAIECGLPDIEPRLVDLRIVGGTTAIRGSWPWMVSMKLVGQHFCGGVLVSKEWVVTSAHCMLFMPGMDDPRRWEIRLGRFDPGFNITEPKTEQRFNISGEPIFYDAIDLDRLHSGLPVDNDIVLLKLDRSVIVTPWVKPICLPAKQLVSEDGERCVIIGYGQTIPNIGFSVKLKQAVVPIVEFERCKTLEGYAELLTPRMICAGYAYGGVDTCKMDSGGPLQCFSNGRWVVTGITSWGDAGGSGCAQPLRPGVYTKIADYVYWIQTMIYENYIQMKREQMMDI